MKKLALLLITVLATSFTTIETSKLNDDKKEVVVKAEFVGKSKKSLYFKKVEDSKMMEFTVVNMSVLSTYDFGDKANIGQIFNITYEVQKVEKSIDKPEDNDAKVLQFVERQILMKVAKLDER